MFGKYVEWVSTTIDLSSEKCNVALGRVVSILSRVLLPMGSYIYRTSLVIVPMVGLTPRAAVHISIILISDLAQQLHTLSIVFFHAAHLTNLYPTLPLLIAWASDRLIQLGLHAQLRGLRRA